jgi:hypothetical protein
MNFIVSYILTLLNPENEQSIQDYYVIDSDFESDCFLVLVYIMKIMNWRELFLDGTPRLFTLLAELESRLLVRLPNILDHIKFSGVK